MNTVNGFCDFNIPFPCSPSATLMDVVERAIKRNYLVIFILVAGLYKAYSSWLTTSTFKKC